MESEEGLMEENYCPDCKQEEHPFEFVRTHLGSYSQSGHHDGYWQCPKCGHTEKG